MIYMTATSNPIPGRKEEIQKGRGLGQCCESDKIPRRLSRERKRKRVEGREEKQKLCKDGYHVVVGFRDFDP